MMRPSLIDYFFDPILQAPTFASILMCLSSALVGVVVVLRRRSLLGEALSHAAYPGVILSAWVCSLFFTLDSDATAITTLLFAFMAACLGLWTIIRLEGKGSVKEDTALCFVIASFFGLGVLLASRIQLTQALFYKAAQLFLYGQAATMTGIHVVIYAILTVLICLLFLVFFHPIRTVLFDKQYAVHALDSCKTIEVFLLGLLALAIIVGIRSVGVVLMSGILIAPAIAACQLSCRLHHVFIIAALIGASSGFLGNYLSFEIPFWVSETPSFSLPTGPMILLSSGTICTLTLLFGRRAGFVTRQWRIWRFKKQCLEENILKYLLRTSQPTSLKILRKAQGFSSMKATLLVRSLFQGGWVTYDEHNQILLTTDGNLRANKIVRLHRLWEAYLVSLGQGVEKVHASAEEMEHIISPELEKHLSLILGDPKHDPHCQPIPPQGGSL